jgi:nucleolar pre-ribosomal-associated protein 1
MNEIESSDCRVIDEVDHLGGSAVLKFREELKLDFSKFDTHDTEDVEITERRKMPFRENIHVDSKLCAKTALQYCHIAIKGLQGLLLHWNNFIGIALLIILR